MIGEIKYLIQSDIDYIKPRMRAQDKKELEVQNWYEQLYLLPYFNESYCYHVDNPIAALGVIEVNQCVHLWFFATDEVSDYWKTITEFSKGYLSWVQREHFGKHIMVQCMVSHRVSMLWLRRLGFEKTKHLVVKQEEKLILMEYKGVI